MRTRFTAGSSLYEGIQAVRNRREVRHIYHRRHIIVPEIDKLNKHYRNERTHNKGKVNPKEDGEVPCAVHVRRFVEILRQRPKHCVEYQVIHTKEVCLHEEHTPNGIVQTERLCHTKFGRQATDDGQDHGYDNDGVNHLVELEVKSRSSF